MEDRRRRRTDRAVERRRRARARRSGDRARRSTAGLFGAKTGTDATLPDQCRRNRSAASPPSSTCAAHAWSPDGQWLAIAANRDGEPHLFKVPVDGGPPILLVKEYSTDPVWAPSGQFLVYSGADVGTTFPVKAVNADGAPHTLPNLVLTRGARRLAFPAGDDALVFLKGDISHREFWVVDLETGRDRQLTNLGRE